MRGTTPTASSDKPSDVPFWNILWKKGAPASCNAAVAVTGVGIRAAVFRCCDLRRCGSLGGVAQPCAHASLQLGSYSSSSGLQIAFHRKFARNGTNPHWLGLAAHLCIHQGVSRDRLFGEPRDHFVWNRGRGTVEWRRDRHAAYVAAVAARQESI